MFETDQVAQGIKRLKKLLVAGLSTLAMLTSLDSQASTAELRLVGTIVPSACIPTFNGGTTINFGNIPVESLSRKAQTSLPQRQTSLNIRCSAPTVFFLQTRDERSASLARGLTTEASIMSEQQFGLGTTREGANIGAYSLQMTNETSSKGKVKKLLSIDSGSTWTGHTGAVRSDSRGLISFSESDSATVPAAHTSIDLDVLINAVIDSTSNLPIHDATEMDGLMTVEVLYP